MTVVERFGHEVVVPVAKMDGRWGRAEAAQALASTAPEIQSHGGPREQAYKNNVSLHGNAAQYRVRRLKRDAPDVADRLAAGEFKSVAAAVRAARGEPQPIDLRWRPTVFRGAADSTGGRGRPSAVGRLTAIAAGVTLP